MAKKQDLNGSDADGYPEDEMPVDQPDPDEVKDSEVAPSPFEEVTVAEREADGADPIPAEIETKAWNGAIAAMNGTVGELHAVQTRLAEMVPFLPAAIDKATGDVKGFLQALADHL